jgi:hypothetical protein
LYFGKRLTYEVNVFRRGDWMDPITLILSALSAGAGAGGQSVTNNLIKDVYTGLKTLVQRKFTGKPGAELALQEHESDPQTWEVPLKKALTEAHVEQDAAIIEAAQKMMTLVQPQQAAMGKYNVQITGNVQGYAQGDHQQITMNFGNAPKDE